MARRGKFVNGRSQREIITTRYKYYIQIHNSISLLFEIKQDCVDIGVKLTNNIRNEPMNIK